MLVDGLDVLHFQHNLDSSARSLVGGQANRMVLAQVGAKVQCDTGRALALCKWSIAARAFRLQSDHPPVEIERCSQVACEEFEAKGRAPFKNPLHLLVLLNAATAAQRPASAAPRSARGVASAARAVGRSLEPEFLVALGCVSSGQQPGCFLDFDGLHHYAFMPIDRPFSRDGA